MFNDRVSLYTRERKENLEKLFYLKLTDELICVDISPVDSTNIDFTKKAIVFTALFSNCYGKWEDCQLSDELEVYVAKNRNQFRPLN